MKPAPPVIRMRRLRCMQSSPVESYGSNITQYALELGGSRWQQLAPEWTYHFLMAASALSSPTTGMPKLSVWPFNAVTVTSAFSAPATSFTKASFIGATAVHCCAAQLWKLTLRAAALPSFRL